LTCADGVFGTHNVDDLLAVGEKPAGDVPANIAQTRFGHCLA
jgi:hypothetical protein